MVIIIIINKERKKKENFLEIFLIISWIEGTWIVPLILDIQLLRLIWAC